MYEKDSSVTDAAILRDVYGRNAAKKIARDWGVAVVTAKLWLAGRFPEARTQQLVTAIRAEIGRTNARNAEILRQLDAAGDVADRALARSTAGAVLQRGDGHRKTARRLGGEVAQERAPVGEAGGGSVIR